jgi:hypothetical protein
MQYMTQRVYCSSWGSRVPARPTTLLDLARTLLDRARDDIKERVPIVLNLSSWKTKQPLAEWISSELSEKYRVPRKMARFWLRHDYLLPLLDGLDEIETSMQPNCVAAINAFIEELKLSGLVVCCRLNEYRWLPERLKLNGAICLEPLSSEEVSKYLAEGGPTLEALREAVNTDTVLHELTQIPLMLSIMSLAYQGADGNELARQEGNSTEEQRRNQIFGLYVEKMFQRKGTISLVFPKEKTISWLSWLARNMREHSHSVFLVEGLQPIWLGTRAKRVVYGIIVALDLGLSGGLIFGPSAGLSTGLIILMGVGLGRVKSRWFRRDQALCVATDSLVERIYATQVCQIPRSLRQADSPEESGRWLHLHPPDATRILRRDDPSRTEDETTGSVGP